LERVAQRADCLADAVYVQNAVTCPAPTCGNGMQEPGEECDDGNSFEGDGCRSNCTKSNCDVFPSTYDLIQQAIFENHGCTADACHGSGRSGGLDLRADVSYQNLIDMPAQSVVGVKRVDPGSKDTSLLWINLAAKTLPDQWRAPLQPMPIGLDALSTDEVEALRLWIEKGGASRTGSVEGTASLLQACLPEPKPVEITPLPPPAPGEGVQIHMPAWTLAPGSESEVCFSSYFDFSAQVPAELLNADGTKFRYKEVQIRQNPLSHHLIVDIYRGSEAADDPAWGPYTCKAGPHKGEACNPYDLDFCREAGACATDPDPYAIACIGFGPQTSFSTLVNGGLAFAQESAAEFRFPAGVFSEVPVKGIALFNSHAFNLTRQTGKMEAWMNIYFPKPEEQKHQEVQIFDTSKIFWTDSFPPFPLPELAPFEKMEVCQIHTFRSSIDPPNEFDPAVVSPGKTVHLFELSGHMHEHGKRFQIFRGSFTCKGGTKAGAACSPFNADLCPEGTCTEDTGRDPQQSLLYTNLIYNDPVVLRFDTPLLFSGAAPSAERSLTYCAVYDNGAPPNIQDVKRRSTSPPAGSIIGIKVGGPCRPSKTRCIGGPHHNEACNGDNAACDSSPGAGDGDCDACPLTGGFRTKDEMFILFGNFWVE
jgi:cysteine-rich repeat protein